MGPRTVSKSLSSIVVAMAMMLSLELPGGSTAPRRQLNEVWVIEAGYDIGLIHCLVILADLIDWAEQMYRMTTTRDANFSDATIVEPVFTRRGRILNDW
jgi:hypothetical protein